MSHRRLASSCIALFALSTAFPVVAGLLGPGDKPRWLGITDVAIAAITFVVAASVVSRGRTVVTDRHRLAALRVGQRILGVIPVLIAAFLVLGSRLDWTVLAVGLAWRGWLLLYTLPFLVAVLDGSRDG